MIHGLMMQRFKVQRRNENKRATSLITGGINRPAAAASAGVQPAEEKPAAPHLVSVLSLDHRNL